MERVENIEQRNFVEIEKSQNMIEAGYFISKLTKNELDLDCGSHEQYTDVNQESQKRMVRIDILVKEELCQITAVSSAYMFNCNIAEVIKMSSKLTEHWIFHEIIYVL